MSTPRILDQFGRPLPTARERAAAELQAKSRAKLQAAYDAAQWNQESAKHWRFADSLSPQLANSLSVRRTLRSRSRYECLESNSFANGMVKTLANDFVTTGPGLQVLIEGKADLNRRIESAWKKWTKQIKLNQKLRTARLSKAVDGEAFMIATTNPKLKGKVKLDIKLVEADQVSTPDWIDGALDPNAVDGIKFDEDGNPIEYHLLKSHPGDNRNFGKTDFDPVSPEYVIHLFQQLRAGQARGIPEVTPALPLFAMLRRYTLATLLAAETAADFAIVLKTMANAFNHLDGTANPQNPFETVDIDRGMMTALPYGYEMQQMKAEQPTTTYEIFRNAILQEIARCIHMPSNKARGDSSGYNYSSARLDHQIYYHAIEVERSDWEDECLDRIFVWWLAEAKYLIPGLTPSDIDEIDGVPHKWTWKPVISVNPLQDAQAAVLLRDAGLMTEADYFYQQQVDPEQQWIQLAKEFAERAARISAIAAAQQVGQMATGA